MATDEQRFAIGLAVTASAIAALVLLFSVVDLDDDETPSVRDATAPTVSELSSDSGGQISVDAAGAAPSGNAAAAPPTGDAATDPVAGRDADGAVDAGGNAEPGAPETPDAPVIDPVPLAYFEPDSNTLNLPPVIEKYLERVERGTRFMARLEDIVADRGLADAASNGGEPPLTFAAHANTKRLSFNAVHTTRWVEAVFANGAAPATADVLVDVRRGAQLAPPGERVTLFFASVQDDAGASRFALDLDGTEGDVRVIVYALNDALPALGSATVQLDSLRE